MMRSPQSVGGELQAVVAASRWVASLPVYYSHTSPHSEREIQLSVHSTGQAGYGQVMFDKGTAADPGQTELSEVDARMEGA